MKYPNSQSIAAGCGIHSSCLAVTVTSLVFACLCFIDTTQFQLYTSATRWKEKLSKCDIYRGTWVWDSSYPLYDALTCPFIRKEFNCMKYGRTNLTYLKYRWQPQDCELPRFDGKDFLKRTRGKKIMYIGDSTTLNHWQSLICLLHAAVPRSNIISNISREKNLSFSTVTFQDYDVSVMLLSSQFLVDIRTEEIGRVLKLDSIKGGETLKMMDVLIFNSWLWWYRRGVKQPWDYIQEGDVISKDMDRTLAYHKGLMAWAKWVDSNIDPAKTRVFFRGLSPIHYHGIEWNKPGLLNCSMESEPVSGSTYPAGLPTDADTIEEVLRSVSKPVHLLNITVLSQLRKDAHPGSYNGNKGMDCCHWCLPGLPDTWNQLLYVSLLS
ncbi:Trichome birefringence-like, N-terminal domain [Dillenia turbinata]|uniref:Trichome birefringence-like, N-terminal domain n=1 Tax=Dillenia turbinata TaxID=194707 RepID=A0AAN8Z8G9_9MAGN